MFALMSAAMYTRMSSKLFFVSQSIWVPRPTNQNLGFRLFGPDFRSYFFNRTIGFYTLIEGVL